MADLNDFVTQPAPATPSAEPTPAPAIQGAPTPQVAPVNPTAPAQAPATGVPEGYVPSYRLREIREQAELRAQAREAEIRAQYEARVNEWEQKARALAGFGPQPDPKVETIKSQFAELFPGLAKLDDKKVEALLQMAEKMGDVEAQTDHYWRTYGTQSINRLFAAAEADLGQPLTDEAKGVLQANFVGYLNSDPRVADVYASDPTFAERYWKAFSSQFIDPVRRSSNVSAQTRASVPLPQDSRGGAPITAPAAKPANLDERVNLAWTAYNQGKRGQ